jgi:hypothetical protein
MALFPNRSYDANNPLGHYKGGQQFRNYGLGAIGDPLGYAEPVFAANNAIGMAYASGDVAGYLQANPISSVSQWFSTIPTWGLVLGGFAVGLALLGGRRR